MLKLKLNIDCYAILHLSMYMYVSDMTDNLDHNLNQLTCRCLHGNVLVHVRLPVVLKIKRVTFVIFCKFLQSPYFFIQ